MGICGNEGEDRFFDSREDISSDSGSDRVEGLDLSRRSFECVWGNIHYEVWMGTPKSVSERRNNLMKWMSLGSDLDESSRRDSLYFSGEIAIDIDRVTKTSGAVLMNSDSEDEFTSSRSSISSWSSNTADLSANGVLGENFMFRFRNLDDGTEFIVNELGQDGMLNTLREVGSNRLFTIDEFQRAVGLSPSVHQFMRRDVIEVGASVETVKRRKTSWLKRLGAAICIADRQQEEHQLEHGDLDSGASSGVHRVRVRPHRKRSKELSAIYREQEIQAHEGSILTMKFSLDGQYLASAGEDGIVRVWQVTECLRTDDGQIPELDPSCVYFTVNGSSELSLLMDKEKMHKFSSTRKTLDSACIIFPPKTFRISEKPLHEFHGHSGNVLDLSWSKNKYLLSSSEDNTVRLWQVGCSRCLKVFSHSNYVTCVQFNPVNDNYFVSGSIDGKVRIWAIPGCQVVDWTDIREMATAVCYRLDGQGLIVGSMTGNCRFYDASDNHLQLDAQVCLQGKKKSPSKRIIGFQFSPSDPGKVMVASADSQIRVLDGVDIIYKYRGIRNSGNQISARFTSDGSHIISVGEDSNVCIWNHNSPDGPLPQRTKSIRSCERFLSSNASIAIPWLGMKSETLAPNEQVSGDSTGNVENACSHNSLISLSSQNSVSLSHEFFSEAPPKGSATWPEEKLPTSSSPSPASAICKSQYRFLKTSCQNTVTSHAWGLVIVTAGSDGRIRSFHNYGLPVRL
ncbi:hypothetical protein MRB53_025686 [Persea americana]|uniref:Uncharacterized protein n=1 Tax=Persea americana TaxID=3435 RepID=A0ACC2LG76_PERAE|nr:hypothetical protein MRB53_025686 [Persea americana]